MRLACVLGRGDRCAGQGDRGAEGGEHWAGRAGHGPGAGRGPRQRELFDAALLR